MTDERLTDEQLADIEAFVGAHEGRYRWLKLPVPAVAALVREVRALRAERDEVQRVLRVAWDELTELKDDVPAAGAVRNLLLPRIDRTWRGK